MEQPRVDAPRYKLHPAYYYIREHYYIENINKLLFTHKTNIKHQLHESQNDYLLNFNNIKILRIAKKVKN